MRDRNGWIISTFLMITITLFMVINIPAQYQVGNTVSNFTLNDVYGNSHTLYNYQGKIIFLNFFATW